MDLSLLIPIISIILLLIISAFFSGSETALTAASSAKIHYLKTKGNKKALLVSNLLKKKDLLIGALLLGNNAVNISASAIATSVALTLTNSEYGVFYTTIIMTLAVLIFAEVMPKTYAVYNAEKLALFVAPILTIFVKITTPFTSLIQKIVHLILTIFNIKNTGTHLSASDEIRSAIEMHHAAGQVVTNDRDMLSSILDLERVEINDIMVHRKDIISLNIDMDPTELIEDIMKLNHTRIPIWRDTDENIIGILHIRALLTALNTNKNNINKIKIENLITEPWFVPATNTLGNQLLQFRQKRTHLALAVNEYGDLVGLITLEDILEEIVGDIEDEHDKAGTDIKKIADNLYEVRGQTKVRDINRKLGWSLPDDQAATIAGLLINELGYIPQKEDIGVFCGIEFKVIRKNRKQIIRLQISKKSAGKISRR